MTLRRHQAAQALASARGSGQDRAAVVENADGVVIIVADGAGGTGGGTDAAEFTVRELQSFCECKIPSATTLVDEIKRIDEQTSRRGGQTTLVVVVVNEERLFGVSVGDSSAWAISDGTIDDLTARQHRKPLVGSGAASPVTFDRPARHGTLIVSTDGLFKYVTRERIASAVTSSDALPERLIELARLPTRGLQDDIAVVTLTLSDDH